MNLYNKLEGTLLISVAAICLGHKEGLIGKGNTGEGPSIVKRDRQSCARKKKGGGRSPLERGR